MRYCFLVENSEVVKRNLHRLIKVGFTHHRVESSDFYIFITKTDFKFFSTQIKNKSDTLFNDDQYLNFIVNLEIGFDFETSLLLAAEVMNNG